MFLLPSSGFCTVRFLKFLMWAKVSFHGGLCLGSLSWEEGTARRWLLTCVSKESLYYVSLGTLKIFLCWCIIQTPGKVTKLTGIREGRWDDIFQRLVPALSRLSFLLLLVQPLIIPAAMAWRMCVWGRGHKGMQGCGQSYSYMKVQKTHVDSHTGHSYRYVFQDLLD